jgi:hypothetical protein
MGGQAHSEDDRRCSFELPTHPRFLRFSSTLVVLWIFLLSLVTVGYVFYERHNGGYRRLPAAQQRRPRKGVRLHARRHLPLPSSGGR